MPRRTRPTHAIQWLLFACCLCDLATIVDAAEIKLPAATAYLQPDQGGARVSAGSGTSPGRITRWTDPQTRIVWFGRLKKAGSLEITVQLHLPAGSTSRLKMSVGDQQQETVVTSQNAAEPTLASFGTFKMTKPGYHSFALESLNPAGQDSGTILNLVLKGQPAEDAHFNLKPRRNAASVHLFYPVPKRVRVSAFYCEMTALEDPIWSYYMACGWHRGYFGMQVNSPTERRIIFSVWDSGNEAVDRAKVAAEDRVTLVAKGADVYAGGFGNEGTGGHSHLKFQWETGAVQRFLVTAEPVDQSHTVYSGYYFRRDLDQWMLISSWKAPHDGQHLRGLYSFSENFVGRNGHLRRKALYGNQWIRSDEGDWIELTAAKFSYDATGRADRLDRFMGLEQNQFFLSHGGFIDGSTRYGTMFERPPTSRSPAKQKLPPLPAAVPSNPQPPEQPKQIPEGRRQ